ncbi:hypothetical protein, partial [Treponema sp. R80B11-R83G3]
TNIKHILAIRICTPEPALYILDSLFGFNGFIFALPTADICTVILAFTLSRPLFRIMRGE